MRWVAAPIILLVGHALCAPANARTVGGDLLWQNQVNLIAGEVIAQTIAAGNGRVATVGSAQNVDGNSDLLVRVYEAATGVALWEDRVDVEGGDDGATAVVVEGSRLIVGGSSVDGTGTSQLILRAYTAKTGVMEWEARSLQDLLIGLAVAGTRVLVTGSTTNLSGSPSLFVRAYIARSGELDWENDQPILPQGYDQFSLAPQVAVHGQRVFLVGTARMASPDFNPTCVVRAHNVRSGQIIWESLHPTACRAMAIATDGKRVVIAGQGTAGLDDINTQSFDADTGEFLWEARSGITSGFENALVAVDIERKLAFVAGWIRWVPGSQNQEAFLVRAYHAETGVLHWEDQFPGPDPFVARCLCHGRDLVAQNGRVVVVGVAVFSLAHGPGTWLVRTYDAKDGNLLWADDFTTAGGVGGTPYSSRGGLGVAIDGGRTFVIGAGINADGETDSILRAYDLK
jgi:outer membrane protein assembly factor BamB